MEPIVTKEMTAEARREVDQLGARPAMVRLERFEPELVEHVNRGMDRIWAKLEEYGLKDEKGWMRGIDGDFYPLILGQIISALEALRKAQYELVTKIRNHRCAEKIEELQRLAGDSPTVHVNGLDDAEAAFWPLGRDRAMRQLHLLEPELSKFVNRVVGSINDGLEVADVPEQTRELVLEQISVMGAVCVCATRDRYCREEVR
jgi:hypothetical protein